MEQLPPADPEWETFRIYPIGHTYQCKVLADGTLDSYGRFVSIGGIVFQGHLSRIDKLDGKGNLWGMTRFGREHYYEGEVKDVFGFTDPNLMNLGTENTVYETLSKILSPNSLNHVPKVFDEITRPHGKGTMTRKEIFLFDDWWTSLSDEQKRSNPAFKSFSLLKESNKKEILSKGMLLYSPQTSAGNFEDGVLHGEGCHVSPKDFCKYVGSFHYGKMHGIGRLTFTKLQECWEYFGQWKNGLMHGYGLETIGSLIFYRGEFQNGRPQGSGFFCRISEVPIVNSVFESVPFTTSVQKLRFCFFINLKSIWETVGDHGSPEGFFFFGSWIDNRKYGQGVLSNQGGGLILSSYKQGKECAIHEYLSPDSSSNHCCLVSLQDAMRGKSERQYWFEQVVSFMKSQVFPLVTVNELCQLYRFGFQRMRGNLNWTPKYFGPKDCIHPPNWSKNKKNIPDPTEDLDLESHIMQPISNIDFQSIKVLQNQKGLTEIEEQPLMSDERSSLDSLHKVEPTWIGDLAKRTQELYSPLKDVSLTRSQIHGLDCAIHIKYITPKSPKHLDWLSNLKRLTPTEKLTHTRQITNHLPDTKDLDESVELSESERPSAKLQSASRGVLLQNSVTLIPDNSRDLTHQLSSNNCGGTIVLSITGSNHHSEKVESGTD